MQTLTNRTTGGTFTLQTTLPAYRRWYKPWTWRNEPTVISTNPMPYDLPAVLVQDKLRDIINPVFVTCKSDGTSIITFGGDA